MIIFFEFHVLEVPIPLKNRAPLLSCIVGHKIIILCSQLLEICPPGVWGRGTLICMFKFVYSGDPWVAQQFSACLLPRA